MTLDPLTLAEGELSITGRVMPASNATFLGTIGATDVVYKPTRGERPLWDFPDHTLAEREVAAYRVSVATGWDLVPLTVLRDGPFGPGMVQLWQTVDPDSAAVRIVDEGEVPARFLHVFDGFDAHDRGVSLVHEDTDVLRRMALFDVVVNNADRKGGHVLALSDGRRYGVDHGLTFHTEPKLRTVLWGWAGEPLREEEREALDRLRGDLAGGLGEELLDLISEPELDACAQRCSELLLDGRFPFPRDAAPAIPWPPF